MTAFDDAARAARDAAFATFGLPVAVDPDGADLRALAQIRAQSIRETFGPMEIVQRGRFLLMKAEDAAQVARGATIALLDAAGAEIERRVQQGEPICVDRRRLVVEIDTRPA